MQFATSRQCRTATSIGLPSTSTWAIQLLGNELERPGPSLARFPLQSTRSSCLISRKGLRRNVVARSAKRPRGGGVSWRLTAFGEIHCNGGAQWIDTWSDQTPLFASQLQADTAAWRAPRAARSAGSAHCTWEPAGEPA